MCHEILHVLLLGFLDEVGSSLTFFSSLILLSLSLGFLLISSKFSQKRRVPFSFQKHFNYRILIRIDSLCYSDMRNDVLLFMYGF